MGSYIIDIHESKDKICCYMRQHEEKPGMVLDAILRCVRVIQQAPLRVQKKERAMHPELPWAKMDRFWGLDLDRPVVANEVMRVVSEIRSDFHL